MTPTDDPRALDTRLNQHELMFLKIGLTDNICLGLQHTGKVSRLIEMGLARRVGTIRGTFAEYELTPQGHAYTAAAPAADGER